jgi:hypothetical protein
MFFYLDLLSDNNAYGFVLAHSAVKHDKQQDGQGNEQDSTGQNTAEVISSSTKLHEHPHVCQNLHQTGITECFHFLFLIDIQFMS